MAGLDDQRKVAVSKPRYVLTGRMANVFGHGFKQGLVRSTSWTFGVANEGGHRVNYMLVVGIIAYQLEEKV